MYRYLGIFMAAMLLVPAARADQIILKNGDRLTGSIEQSDGKTLTIKSEFAGKVTVPLDAIVQISSEQPLYLTLKDSQTIVGTVKPAGDKLEVLTSEAGTVAFSKDSIQALRSKDAQEAYVIELDRLRNPGLGDLWSGTADAGLSLARGNAESITFTAGMNAARTTTRDKISVYMNTIYAKNSTAGPSIATANAKRGGARYDINVSERVFAFGLGDLEFDEFQKLDLRVGLGGGMGWHIVKKEHTTFDFFGGGSLNKEYFSTGLKRTSGEVILGQELSHKLSARTSFKERLVFLPNLNETGEYRMNLDVSAVTNISTWLGWHVTFSNRYLSNPVLGAQANDVLLSTGVRFTFGQ